MTPYADLFKTNEINKPDIVLTSFVKVVDQVWFDEYVEKWSSDFASWSVIISGIGTSNSNVDKKKHYKVNSAEHMIEVLAHIDSI
mgnify:CR=1 FL=1